jgi:hypothetical protein
MFESGGPFDQFLELAWFAWLGIFVVLESFFAILLWAHVVTVHRQRGRAELALLIISFVMVLHLGWCAAARLE